MLTTPLKDVFSGEPPKSSQVEVKILKSFSKNRFVIADDSDFCELLFDEESSGDQNHQFLKLNTKLRIVNPKYDYEKKALRIQSTTKILQIQEHQNPNEIQDCHEDSKSDKMNQKQMVKCKEMDQAGPISNESNLKETLLCTKTNIKEVFEFRSNEIKHWVLIVEVLHEKSTDLFVIADDCGHCELKIQCSKFRNDSIKEGKYLKIYNPKIDRQNDMIVLENCSKIKSISYIPLEKKKFKYCKGCEEVQKANSLLKHIAHSKKCLNFYGESQFEEMKKNKRSYVNYDCYFKHRSEYKQTRDKKRQEAKKNLPKKKHSSEDDTNEQSMTTDEPVVKSKEEIEDEELAELFKKQDRLPSQYGRNHFCPFCKNVGFTFHWQYKDHMERFHTYTCEGCDTSFPEKSFFKHVSHTPECKSVYGERWNEMLQKKRSKVIEKYQRKRKNKQKKYYEKVKEKYQAKYQENKEKICAEKRQLTKEKQEGEKRRQKIRRLNEDKKSMEKKARKHILVWKRVREHDLQKFKDIRVQVDSNWIQRLACKINCAEEQFGKKINEAFEKIKDSEDWDQIKVTYLELMKCFEDDGEWKKFQNEADDDFRKLASALGLKLTCYECSFVGIPRWSCPKCRQKNEFAVAERAQVNEENNQNVLIEKEKLVDQKFIKREVKPVKRCRVDESPKIKKKPLIRKRKKITFTMQDLEEDKDSDEDFKL